MSLFGKLLGIGQMVGGGAMIAFSGGTLAPVGAGLIASGASTLAGDMGSDAAKGAAETQSKAADTALAEQRDIFNQTQQVQRGVYDQTRADLYPYIQTGQASMGNLRELTGLPALPPMPASTVPTMSAPGAQPVPMPDEETRRPGSVRRLPESEKNTAARVQSESSYGGGTLAGLSGLIPMQAPNGEVMPVPKEQVEHYKSLGARVVN